MKSLSVKSTRIRGAGVVCLGFLALAACSSANRDHASPASEGVTDRAISDFDVIGGPNVTAVLWRDGYQFVRIENSQGAPASTPIQLNNAQVRQMLASVRIAKGDGDPFPAFDAYEISVLADPLTKALAQMQPGQEIGFSVRYSAGIFALGQRFITAGKIFPDNGSLDIIFGTVRAPYSGQLVATGIPPTIQTGSRKEQTQVDYQVVAEGPISRPVASRADWAQIAPAAWAVVPQPAPQPAPQPVAAPAYVPAYQQPAPSAVPQAPGVAPAPAVAPAVVPSQEVAPPPSRDPDDIAKRLETLNNLRQKHLITEEEYARYKAELLKRL